MNLRVGTIVFAFGQTATTLLVLHKINPAEMGGKAYHSPEGCVVAGND